MRRAHMKARAGWVSPRVGDAQYRALQRGSATRERLVDRASRCRKHDDPHPWHQPRERARPRRQRSHGDHRVRSQEGRALTGSLAPAQTPRPRHTRRSRALVAPPWLKSSVARGSGAGVSLCGKEHQGSRPEATLQAGPVPRRSSTSQPEPRQIKTVPPSPGPSRDAARPALASLSPWGRSLPGVTPSRRRACGSQPRIRSVTRGAAQRGTLSTPNSSNRLRPRQGNHRASGFTARVLPGDLRTSSPLFTAR